MVITQQPLQGWQETEWGQKEQETERGQEEQETERGQKEHVTERGQEEQCRVVSVGWGVQGGECRVGSGGMVYVEFSGLHLE